MGGAGHGNTNFQAIDIGSKIVENMRRQNKDSYECNFCHNMVFSMERSLWSHITTDHREKCPQDGDELLRFRTHMKEICQRKGADALSRPENIQTSPNNSNTFIRWSSKDASKDVGGQKMGRKVEPGDQTGPPAYSGGNVDDIANGTSHITLEHPDIQMADASVQARLVNRKRNGPDSATDGGPPTPTHNTHRESQSKRTRGGTSGKGAGNRGPLGNPGFPNDSFHADISSGRAAHKPLRTPLDPDFDRSRFKTEQYGDNEGGMVTRVTAPSRRLFDPEKDHPGAFKGEEDSSKRLEEPNLPPRALSRPKGSTRRKAPVLYTPAPSRKIAVPASQALTLNREGGQMMILENFAQSQPTQPPQGRQTRPPQFYGGSTLEDNETRMVRQPETRPISPEQLIAEVKGIYAGLVMVEAKCAEVDAKQAAATFDDGQPQPRLNDEQWQALIALHRTLLHEHHDFFLASQHPSASPALRRLADKYAMPARMWRHGIYSFLELLRHRLPMMALLYETVPAFEDTWVECLGDLGRYRMAIEDDDIRDRDVWAGVARFWYSKATDKTPYVGRLFHHLAILARPNVLQQLFYYCKSLAVTQPFYPARESILTLFDPIFSPEHANKNHHHVDSGFIQLHGINFTHIDLEKFDDALFDYLDNLDQNIGKTESDWKYGAKESLLRIALREGKNRLIPEEDMEDAPPAAVDENPAEFDSLLPPLPTGASSEHVTSMLQPASKLEEDSRYPRKANVKSGSQAIEADAKSRNGTAESLSFSKRLAYEILSVALQRVGDSNVLPHIHIWLVFLAYVVKSEPAIRLLENEFPWEHLVYMLNSLVGQSDQDRFGCKEFPVPEKGRGRPLPEDYTLRGLEWARKYFPNRWFEDAQVDEEERSVEVPSMENVRIERILWLAAQVAANGECLVYADKMFRVHPALVTRIEEHQKLEATTVHKQELGGSRMTPTSEDSDVEMTSGENESEDGEYVLVGQSEEVRRLKQQQRQLKSQLKACGKAADSAEEPKRAVAKGPESLKENFSVLVVDTNLLLSQPEVFKLMVSTFNWPIVIPNTGMPILITELLGLTNSTGPVGDAAKAAMIAINEALNDKRDVKVVTAKGSNVTNIGFYKEQLDKPRDDEQRKIDDIIIETTKLQGEARRQAIPGDYGDYEAAVLITEDRNMRVKANARGVTAISASALKKVLSPRAGLARPKRKSLGAPTTVPDWPDDEMTFMEPGEEFDSVLNVNPIGTVRKKRQLKRGKPQGADLPKVT
ncbi:hypothetical protein B9Z19DRAFT_1069268 [Tuber borchii]|uniref:PIN domain-containing protein n=1 Tax=Tuber borchii TaxID=42251 RepID=A0A2T6ZC76_TUBBO|nr:hypothetical protein B9Z19DRAFT_1069268 [Tuber borchii]